MPPDHTSPMQSDEPSIMAQGDLRSWQEEVLTGDPQMKSVFTAWSIEDCLENRAMFHNEKMVESQEATDDLDTIGTTEEYWGVLNPPPNIHIHMKDEMKDKWVKGYESDPVLGKMWSDPASLIDNWKQGQQFFRTDEGLLFFHDEGFHP